MTTTPDLLTEALHAQARLSDLSDQMAEAKCDLQRAVVKLNESGVSLREIADESTGAHFPFLDEILDRRSPVS